MPQAAYERRAFGARRKPRCERRAFGAKHKPPRGGVRSVQRADLPGLSEFLADGRFEVGRCKRFAGSSSRLVFSKFRHIDQRRAVIFGNSLWSIGGLLDVETPM